MFVGWSLGPAVLAAASAAWLVLLASLGTLYRSVRIPREVRRKYLG